MKEFSLSELIFQSVKELPTDERLMKLLLNADESLAAVTRYYGRGLKVTTEWNGATVGIAVLIRIGFRAMEIKNISVEPELQRRGIGSKLIEECVGIARKEGCRMIRIVTANAGLGQLALYQRMGFRMVRIIRDFFKSADYPTPIVENGIECLDMVVLERKIDRKVLTGS